MHGPLNVNSKTVIPLLRLSLHFHNFFKDTFLPNLNKIIELELLTVGLMNCSVSLNMFLFLGQKQLREERRNSRIGEWLCETFHAHYCMKLAEDGWIPCKLKYVPFPNPSDRLHDLPIPLFRPFPVEKSPGM